MCQQPRFMSQTGTKSNAEFMIAAFIEKLD
jgi:hypothetical protein